MSRIEQVIGEIEEYIAGCRKQPFSASNIVVNKEELEELLAELRLRVPEEIKKYQRIIEQQDAILADARVQASSMISDAQTQIDELVSEHEVYKQACERANEVEEEARLRGESIVNNAISDANDIRRGAVDYTDGLLARVQDIVSQSMSQSQQRMENELAALRDVYEICGHNRGELNRSGNGEQ